VLHRPQYGDQGNQHRHKKRLYIFYAPANAFLHALRVRYSCSYAPETPRSQDTGVLLSFHLFTLFRKGTSMETDRTLSRPTLTVQDMTVDSAQKPILPSVDTSRCGLRPSPGTADVQPTKRRERFSCILEHASRGCALLTPYGALLELLSHVCQTMIEYSNVEYCLAAGAIHPWS